MSGFDISKPYRGKRVWFNNMYISSFSCLPTHKDYSQAADWSLIFNREEAKTILQTSRLDVFWYNQVSYQTG